MAPVKKNNRAIIFVHGILGFSSRRILTKEIHYFRALQPQLRDSPRPVYFPALPSVSLIEDRARSLARYLDHVSEDRIDLIAHSMGGLDSRYLIHHLDPQQRIRSLSTIATPHRGSPLAQWTLDNKSVLSAFLRRLTEPGLHDLTPDDCARFNSEISDRSDVIYCSYAGHRPAIEMPLIFRPWARNLQKSDGDNDSQVPVASAIWGEFKGILRADHLELAGWSFSWPKKRNERPFAHISFYRNLVQQLCSG